MVRVLGLLGLLGLSVGLACAGCGSTERDAQPGVEPPRTSPEELEAWLQRLEQALCEQDQRCPSLGSPEYVSLESCLDERFGQWADYHRYLFGEDLYLAKAQLADVPDEETRAACIGSLLACNALQDSPCPPGGLVPRAGLQAGDACLSGRRETQPYCAAELYCAGSDPCGTCQRRRAAGEVCTGAELCEAGLYCAGTSYTVGDVVMDKPGWCAPLALEGEPCGDAPCQADLACFDGVCRSPRALGESCDHNDHCAGRLQCVERVCRATPGRLELGAPCVNAGAACAHPLQCGSAGVCVGLAEDGASCSRTPWQAGQRCRRWCVFETPDAEEGTCGAPAVTNESTPCSLYRWDSFMSCPVGTRPDTLDEQASYPELPRHCLCIPDEAPPACGE